MLMGIGDFAVPFLFIIALIIKIIYNNKIK